MKYDWLTADHMIDIWQLAAKFYQENLSNRPEWPTMPLLLFDNTKSGGN